MNNLFEIDVDQSYSPARVAFEVLEMTDENGEHSYSLQLVFLLEPDGGDDYNRISLVTDLDYPSLDEMIYDAYRLISPLYNNVIDDFVLYKIGKGDEFGTISSILKKFELTAENNNELTLEEKESKT